MRQRLMVWGLILFVALWTTSCFAEDSHDFVVSGVVVNSGNAKLMDRFVAELSRKSGYPLTPRFVATYSELSTILRQHPDALAWTCGGPFVEDSIKDPAVITATYRAYNDFIAEFCESNPERLIGIADIPAHEFIIGIVRIIVRTTQGKYGRIESRKR